MTPVSGTELRGILALELALAQEGGYTPSLRIGDEMQAYTRTPRGADEGEKRWILFRKAQLGWLPDHVRDRARHLLDLCPRGILVELAVYLYGDIASGFFYELRRNRDFAEEKCELRGNTSVFRYRSRNSSEVARSLASSMTISHSGTKKHATNSQLG